MKASDAKEEKSNRIGESFLERSPIDAPLPLAGIGGILKRRELEVPIAAWDFGKETQAGDGGGKGRAIVLNARHLQSNELSAASRRADETKRICCCLFFIRVSAPNARRRGEQSWPATTKTQPLGGSAR